MSLTLSERLHALIQLGDYLRAGHSDLDQIICTAEQYNRWFTETNIRLALDNMVQHFLTADALEKWVAHYPILQMTYAQQQVGLVLAGNIPAVGFHDILCTFVAGHTALIKYSDKDRFLLPFLLQQLARIEERAAAYFKTVMRLQDFDAVIATGSDNSARYFKQYFGKYPNIIRQNRNAVAVLTGAETADDFRALGMDIFTYFGLGCRSVSKLYVPEGYDFSPMLAVLDEQKDLMQHNKYKNNYDYNRSIYLLNRMPHFANDCIMLLEDPSLLSRIAALHYEQYTDAKDLEDRLSQHLEGIQCVLSQVKVGNWMVLPFGSSQQPHLQDYADGVDTMEFLLSIK